MKHVYVHAYLDKITTLILGWREYLYHYIKFETVVMVRASLQYVTLPKLRICHHCPGMDAVRHICSSVATHGAFC